MTPWPANPTAESDATWASRIAEQLPAGDVDRLARAATRGPGAVQALRGQAGAAVLRAACDQLLARLPAEGSAFIAGLLDGAGVTVERTRERYHLDVVWTGPETRTGTGRLTAATIIDLIGQARQEILIVTYAANHEPSIEAALSQATERGVDITILAERHDDNPAYTARGIPFPELRALRLRWAASHRPAGAALHAKIIVVDDSTALVGSANFTSRAMDTNLECGILIRGGPQPHAIRDHITELLATGVLESVRL